MSDNVVQSVSYPQTEVLAGGVSGARALLVYRLFITEPSDLGGLSADVDYIDPLDGAVNIHYLRDMSEYADKHEKPHFIWLEVAPNTSATITVNKTPGGEYGFSWTVIPMT